VGSRSAGKLPAALGSSGVATKSAVRACARLAVRSRVRYPSGVQAFDLPPVPLREDDHGVIRIEGSRVTLDSVVALFDRGATAEEIVQSFPTLALGDVYTVLSYVVVRRGDVDVYLTRRAREEDAAREEAEKRWPSAGLRARLVARRRGTPA
jgi:uncharacterized protein (DUF433 family)